MKEPRYEILENGKTVEFCYRAFGSLMAARSFIARQTRPPSKSGRGWRIRFIQKGEHHQIRDKKTGRIFETS